MVAYTCNGEINYRLNDSKSVIQVVLDHYAVQSPTLDTTDGISLEFADWRMNMHSSNTEPLLRLNIGALENQKLINEQLNCIKKVIKF